jgi:hypothetical protein
VLDAHIYLYLKHVNHTQTILVYINLFIDGWFSTDYSYASEFLP